MTQFKSSKLYDGYSACFRQWKADGTHCRFIHGYGISFRVWFEGELDHRNWVMDFGAAKRAKHTMFREREQIKRLRKLTREEERVLKQTPCFKSLENFENFEDFEDFEEEYQEYNHKNNWYHENDYYDDEDYFEQLYKNIDKLVALKSNLKFLSIS